SDAADLRRHMRLEEIPLKNGPTLIIIMCLALALIGEPGVLQASTGQFTSIDYPKNADGTEAYGINAQGDIVGTYDGGQGISHGFLLRQGRYTAIDDPAGADGTKAYGI